MIGKSPTTAFSAENEYVLVCSRQIDGQEVSGWLSPNADDAVWDAFLETVPVGHFQQSSFWSRAKKLEGWQTIRIVIKWKGEIVGGFQILHQRISFGRIGYIFNPLFRWGYKCVIAHPKILAFAYQMRNFRSAIIRIRRK